MKLLKIDQNSGFFRDSAGVYLPINQVTKEDLLHLVSLTLEDAACSFDEYDEKLVKNEAQRVIYKSIHQKLVDLKSRRLAFLDASARLYLNEYEDYRNPQ